jgi:hypothetical protein
VIIARRHFAPFGPPWQRKANLAVSKTVSYRRRGFDPEELVRMARERRSPEEIVAKLRQVEAQRLRGKTCAEAVRSIGVSEVTYRRWRAEFGGLIRTLGPNHRSV